MLFAVMSRFRPRNKSFWLAQLFESNYGKLSELIPELQELSSDAIAFSCGKPALQLTLIDRTRYTLTVELNYRFSSDLPRSTMPRFRIRVYLDGKCAEALYGGQPCKQPDFQNPRGRQGTEVLEDKWTANYLLERWLTHCLISRYRFEPRSETERPEICA